MPELTDLPALYAELAARFGERLPRLPPEERTAADPRGVINTYATCWRAEDAARLRRFGAEAIDCADLHARWLAVVRPRVVLCIGNGPWPSAWTTMQAVFRLTEDDLRARRVAPRTFLRWSDVSAEFASEALGTELGRVLVLAVPHLSYARAAALEGGVGEVLAAEVR